MASQNTGQVMPPALALPAGSAERRAGRAGGGLRRLARDPGGLAGLLILIAVVLMAAAPQLLAPADPEQQVLRERRQPPALASPLGRDELGRDILSRIVYGARATLTAGVLAVLIGVALGVPIGLIAGFHGGTVDAWLMRSIDAVLSFPYFLLAVMLVAVLGATLFSAIVAVGLTTIPSFARVTRGCVLGLKHNDYILCAEAVGCSVPRLLRAHVLPNIAAPLIVLATLNMATAILGVAALGFLGLGAQPPTAEWGLMLNSGRSAVTVAPHITVFPGLAIMLLVAACNLLGDGLREWLDPRLTR